MIRVTVELLPGGSESSKKEIGRMEFANDGTGTATSGNYNVRLFRRGTTNVVQHSARVENYARKAYPIWVLVIRALKQIYG